MNKQNQTMPDNKIENSMENSSDVSVVIVYFLLNRERTHYTLYSMVIAFPKIHIYWHTQRHILSETTTNVQTIKTLLIKLISII